MELAGLLTDLGVTVRDTLLEVTVLSLALTWGVSARFLSLAKGFSGNAAIDEYVDPLAGLFPAYADMLHPRAAIAGDEGGGSGSEDAEGVAVVGGPRRADGRDGGGGYGGE